MNTSNTLFPGRPDYVGPTTGWFALLHHDTLFEQSHNVNERLDYVRHNKPKNEVALRLHNMVYLGTIAVVCAKRDALDAGYQALRLHNMVYLGTIAVVCAELDALDAELDALDAKCDALDAEILAYVRSVMPDCAWNGTKLGGS
jgi:hypothetical protein